MLCRAVVGSVFMVPTIKSPTATDGIDPFPVGRQYSLHFHSCSVKLYNFTQGQSGDGGGKDTGKLLSHQTLQSFDRALVTQSTSQEETAKIVCYP